MSELPDHYYTLQGRPVPRPSWTADEMAGWDEDDHAAARLAMESALYQELQQVKEENARLREALHRR